MADDFIFALLALLAGLVGIPCVIHSFIAVERREREAVRRKFAELVKEKLDIIHTAVSMGYNRSDIAELDERLEKLIGSEKMLKTLKEAKPDEEANKQMMLNADLVAELETQRQRLKAESGD